MPTAPRLCRRLESGFTIIEVAMASFIMAFGIANSIIVMQSGYKQIDVARGTTLASQIIQSEIERMRLMSWTMINALPATQTFDGTEFFSNSASAEKYLVTRTVADAPGRVGEVKNLTVSVRWQTYDLRWQQRSFTAIYAKNGLYDYYYTLARP
jgi:Tfp pilus assembly protein PilV